MPQLTKNKLPAYRHHKARGLKPERDFMLDGFKWLKDESLEDTDELPDPEELATDTIGELQEAVGELNAVLALLENSGAEEATKEQADALG